jgi:hypothetical protein
MRDDRPRTFEGAQTRFCAFLRQNGIPENVHWLAPGDLIYSFKGEYLIRETSDEHAKQAVRKLYESALSEHFGTAMEALCFSNDRTFARIHIPADQRTAELCLLPPGVLKLSVPIHNPQVKLIRSMISWRLLNWRYHKHNQQLGQAGQKL